MIRITYGTNFDFEYEVKLTREDFRIYTQIPAKNVDFLFDNGWMSIDILEDMYENGDDDGFREFIKQRYEEDAIDEYNDMYDAHISSFDYDDKELNEEFEFEKIHGN